MARTLNSSAPCVVCGQTIPAGARAQNCFGGVKHQGHCAAPRGAGSTEKQVRYALDLLAAYWTPAVFGGRSYDRDALELLSRDEIGAVIDALLYERSL